MTTMYTTMNLCKIHFHSIYFLQVKVIYGEEREVVGQLLSIDNQEGVVKVHGDNVKMLQLRYLCKMRSN